MYSLIVTATSDAGGRRAAAGRGAGGPSAALELDITELSDIRSSCVTMHVNKVHHVTTITRVAEDLGEDEDWLRDVADEMDAEDGVIWVNGVGDDSVMAFTEFGIENLIELSSSTRKTLDCSAGDCSACGLRRMDTNKVSGALEIIRVPHVKNL